MKQCYPLYVLVTLFYKRVGYSLLAILLSSNFIIAQCPENLDFETGDFSGWKCYIGSTEAELSQNFIYLTEISAPIPGRHTMLSSSPGNGLDEYGGFPKNCPNGSGHSIKLGNDNGASEAEGLSYEFTIPITANKYSITYNYAVVIQDPGHQLYEQPRMQVEIYNLTDDEVINCSSFSFVADGILPGFQVSPVTVGTSPVLYKNWSSNTINLDGLEGKRIRFFVKTADCTFTIHFGYAYIDIVTQCSSSLSGATFCNNDTAINVTAPFGYMGYKWFNSTFSQVLGTSQVLHISPPPPAGTRLEVELTPYPGYGCLDTISQLLDTLRIGAFAGADMRPCNLEPVRLGGPPVPGLVYSWSPIEGLSDPNSANPVATPNRLISYELTVKSAEGGCLSKDTVTISPQIIDKSMNLSGNRVFCLGNPDSAVLQVLPSDSIQWFRDDMAVAGATNTQYAVTQSGNYHALIFNNSCVAPVKTNTVFIEVDTAATGIRYPDVEAAINFPIKLNSRDLGVNYQWDPIAQLDDPAIAKPYFRGANAQLYTVSIKEVTGCVTVDTQFVKTYKKIEIYVPSVFTPNADGVNDFLRPLLLGFRKIHYFRIFNRWGQKLFETNTDLPGWDGRVNKILQEPQAVVWMIEAEDIDGKLHRRSGTSMILP